MDKYNHSMSFMEEDSIKVCCRSGAPKSTSGCAEYVSVGKVLSLTAELRGYLSKPTEVQVLDDAAIVLIYDIFGFEVVQTRRFADLLAAETRMRVLMPDFFRGKPWPPDKVSPSHLSELMDWAHSAGNWGIVSEDLKAARNFLLSDGLRPSAALGIIGFCWGGKQVVLACSGQTHGSHLGFPFAAGVCVHGSLLCPEDGEHITAPVLFMPAGNDPPIDPLKAVLDRRPIGSQCDYHIFETETHGFATSRGAWDVPHTRQSIMDALNLASRFFTKNLLP